MPSPHRAELVRVGPGEAVAQRDVAVGRDAQQPEAGAAGKRLADALVHLLERLLHVREPVMPVRDRRLEELVRQVAELRRACRRSRASEIAWPRFGDVVTGAKPTSQKPISSVRCGRSA